LTGGAVRVLDAVNAGIELWIAVLTKPAIVVFEARVEALEASEAAEPDGALNPALGALPVPLVGHAALGGRDVAVAQR
jgi:hypothetical protein